jgi:hypothetical protein
MDINTIEGAYQVNQFGRYVFNNERIVQEKAYGYLAYKDELKSIGQSRKTVVFSDEIWEVGIVTPIIISTGVKK